MWNNVLEICTINSFMLMWEKHDQVWWLQKCKRKRGYPNTEKMLFRRICSIPPELRIQLQFPQEIIVPASQCWHGDVRFIGICCHLGLSDGKAGRIIKQILDDPLSKLHEHARVGRFGNYIGRLRRNLAEGFYRNPYLSIVWNLSRTKHGNRISAGHSRFEFRDSKNDRRFVVSYKSQ